MEDSLSRHVRTLVLALSGLGHLVVLLILLRAAHQTVEVDPHKKSQEELKNQLDYESMVLSQAPETNNAQVILRDEPTPQESPSQPQPVTQPAGEHGTEAVTEPQEMPESKQEEPSESQEKLATAPLPAREHIPLAPDGTQPAEQPEQAQPKKKRKKKKGPQGPPITLAQLTQGFLQSVQREHGAVPQAMDSMEMARHAYGTKVWRILSQSVNARQKALNLFHDFRAQMVVIMTISKDGTLRNLSFEYPAHTPQEIAHFEELLRTAAYSTGLYPPIPTQFKVDMITLRFPVGVNGNQGLHPYQLMYH
jgi:outer membrane biosynthesis protein TonB